MQTQHCWRYFVNKSSSRIFTVGKMLSIGAQRANSKLVKVVTECVCYVQVAMLYMGTRLFVNISQIMFPLYVHDDLQLGGRSIASLPLVMYIMSFIMSILTKTLNKRCGRKVSRQNSHIVY